MAQPGAVPGTSGPSTAGTSGSHQPIDIKLRGNNYVITVPPGYSTMAVWQLFQERYHPSQGVLVNTKLTEIDRSRKISAGDPSLTNATITIDIPKEWVDPKPA